MGWGSEGSSLQTSVSTLQTSENNSSHTLIAVTICVRTKDHLGAVPPGITPVIPAL